MTRAANRPRRRDRKKSPLPVLIVESRYYPEIADDLARGAGAALDKAGVPYERLAVSGVFEIPAAIRLIGRSRRGRVSAATSRSVASFAAKPTITTTFAAKRAAP